MTNFKRAASWIVAFALLAVVGFVPPARSEEPTKATKDEPQNHHAMMMTCAKACSDCQRECDMCARHCADLLTEGKKEQKTTLATCQDCATICAAAAQVVARMGPFSASICNSCAEACAKCGAACEKFPEDKHMAKCAAECRKCEKECVAMVKHTGGK